jgi:hypothetical protein
VTNTLKNIRRWPVIASAVSLIILELYAARGQMTPIFEFGSSFEFVELHGYKFHVRTFGDKTGPPLIVIQFEEAKKMGQILQQDILGLRNTLADMPIAVSKETTP